MLTEKDIKELIAIGEGYNVDFKRTVPAKVRDLTEEVCGFANSLGGYILLGVDDNGTVIGCDIDNPKRSAIEGSIGEVSPMLHHSLYQVSIEGKTIWVIDVPAGKHKPYFFGGSMYVREGANCQKLTNVDEIRESFQRNERIYFDALPVPKANFYGELDKDNFREFRQEAGYSANVPDEQILENLQIFDDEGMPTSGGVLFFSSCPEKYFFHAVLRCVMFKGQDKVLILDDKTFGGPLVQQYHKAIDWLQSKLEVKYIIDGAGPRREVWEVPMAAFKEAIINALAHRDYYEQGASVTIELFDDRVEITNPGELLPVVARNFGRKSLSRNPLLFGLFARMRLVEHIGSGIPRMNREMEDTGLPLPVFETEGMFTVTLYRKRRELGTEGNNKPRKQQSVLEVISQKPRATMEEISASLSISRTSVYMQVKSLKDQGLLRHVGRRRDGYWVLTTPPLHS